MKRAEKYIYLVLGIILIVVIACSITYIVATNNNKTETKEEPNNNQEENNNEDEQVLKDSVTLKNTYQEGNNIIQEYEVILNNKVNNVIVKYNYQSDEAYNNDIHEITGTINNTEIVKRRYININETEYTKENTFNTSNINNIFNEDNFNIIKGTDNKNYLLVQTVAINALSGFNTSNLYVYNDELELISRNMITEEENTDDTSYDVSKMNEVDVDEALALFEEEGTHVLYIGRSGCTYCRQFVPVLNQVQEELNFTTNYLNVDTFSKIWSSNLTSEAKELKEKVQELTDKFTVEASANGETGKLGDLFIENGFTPVLIVIKDGKVVEGFFGYRDADNLTEILEEYL